MIRIISILAALGIAYLAYRYFFKEDKSKGEVTVDDGKKSVEKIKEKSKTLKGSGDKNQGGIDLDKWRHNGNSNPDSERVRDILEKGDPKVVEPKEMDVAGGDTIKGGSGSQRIPQVTGG